MSDSFKDIQTFVVSDDMNGRLDKVLSHLSSDLSRSRIQVLIDGGFVSVNAQVIQSVSTKVKAGDEIVMEVPMPTEGEPVAQDLPLDVVYEDDDLLVINKQAGLVVHPGAGNHDGTLVNALLHHCKGSLSGIGGVMRPGIVHRLDKDTSGLMVVAKHDKAHHGLSDQLADRTLSREYVAVVLGVPTPIKGHVEGSIGRDPRNRQKMAFNTKNGKDAKTFYHMVHNLGGAVSVVNCKLESGRTHQIRVHMQAIGHSLLGDPLYGPQPTAVTSALKKAGYSENIINRVLAFERQALHAKAISFEHPIANEVMSFQAEPADDMINLLKILNK